MALAEIELGFACGEASWTVLCGRVREAMSSLYEGDLVLAAPHTAAPPDAMLGQRAVLEVTRAGSSRRLKGVARRVEDLGATATHRYARVVLVPQLWALSQRTDTRVFQEKPVARIVREVIEGAGLYKGEGELDVPGALGAHPPREYCVQYGESDLAFVLRMLQEEGAPFYFTHDGDAGEALHVAEDGHAYGDAVVQGSGAVAEVTDPADATVGHEGVTMFQLGAELRPTGVMLRDYDFTRPRATLDMSPAFPAERGGRAVYEYPSRVTLYEYDDETRAYPMHDGARQARVRFEALQVGGRAGDGRSNISGLLPGRAFELRGHARAELDGRYLVTSVEHRYRNFSAVPEDLAASRHVLAALRDAGFDLDTSGPRYENRFGCIPASVPYRPARTVPRPLVHGVQTARVVGPAGEEIHTDFHGRIKVQFHWDRLGQEDDRSSCWVRVAQGWGSAGWGFNFIPRVGMEVVVAFLEGDPDRPLVVGNVYNGENNTPYELPGDKTRSTFKTSSSPATGGSNELRFEDAAGKEQIFIQAERDHDTLVKNNQSILVENNRTKTIEGNETNSIAMDRQTQVGGNESKDVQGNLDQQVHGLSGASLAVDMNRSVSAGMSYSVSAGMSLTLTVGSSTISMSPSEITISSDTVKVLGKKLVEIKGKLVKINCPGGGGGGGGGGGTAAKMASGFNAAIAGLPGALQQALSKVLGGVIQQALSALASGKMPDLKSLLGGAVGGLAGSLTGPLGQVLTDALGPAGAAIAQAAGAAINNVFQSALGGGTGTTAAGLPATTGTDTTTTTPTTTTPTTTTPETGAGAGTGAGTTDGPVPYTPITPEGAVPGETGRLSGTAEAARDATETGVMHSLQAASGLRQGLSDVPAWQEVERNHPEVAQNALRRASSPVLREELRRIPSDDTADGRRILQVSGTAGRAGLDAGIREMLGSGR